MRCCSGILVLASFGLSSAFLPPTPVARVSSARSSNGRARTTTMLTPMEGADFITSTLVAADVPVPGWAWLALGAIGAAGAAAVLPIAASQDNYRSPVESPIKPEPNQGRTKAPSSTGPNFVMNMAAKGGAGQTGRRMPGSNQSSQPSGGSKQAKFGTFNTTPRSGGNKGTEVDKIRANSPLSTKTPISTPGMNAKPFFNFPATGPKPKQPSFDAQTPRKEQKFGTFNTTPRSIGNQGTKVDQIRANSKLATNTPPATTKGAPKTFFSFPPSPPGPTPKQPQKN